MSCYLTFPFHTVIIPSLIIPSKFYSLITCNIYIPELSLYKIKNPLHKHIHLLHQPFSPPLSPQIYYQHITNLHLNIHITLPDALLNSALCKSHVCVLSLSALSLSMFSTLTYHSCKCIFYLLSLFFVMYIFVRLKFKLKRYNCVLINKVSPS